MKTITLNVSEAIYRDFLEESQKTHRPAAELIRQAMEEFHRKRLSRRSSLTDRRPASVGGVVQPLTAEEDLLGEMLA